MRLEDIAQILGPQRCRLCNTIMPPAIKCRRHRWGYRIDGLEGLQYLYVVCPKCNYPWAIWKLGYPRPQEIHKAETPVPKQE